MTHEIKNPNPPIYFIAWCLDGEIKHPVAYGKIESHQSMKSGLDFVEIFENEEDYLAKIAEYGITIEEY